MPAPSSTRRCFVIACLVSLEPVVSCEMEYGCPWLSFATSDSRVRSPNAAKTGACSGHAAATLLALCDITFDVLHLLCPAALVLQEGFLSTMRCNVLEAGFDHYQQCPRGCLFQFELNERGCLL